MAAATAAAAAVPLPDDGPPRKKQRRCSVLDLCGSQVVSYQEELESQRDVYNMYVDGSYRPHWPSVLQMSAGGFTRCPPHFAQRTASWLNFSLLLVGGTRGSLPAELGAIYIGCAKLQQAIAAGSIDPASSEVHMHTDCQGAANMLKRKGARVPHGLGPLITGETVWDTLLVNGCWWGLVDGAPGLSVIQGFQVDVSCITSAGWQPIRSFFCVCSGLACS